MTSPLLSMEPASSSIASAVTVQARGVRFDDECILIPDPQPRSRVPKLLAKSSSFIFKRRHSHAHTHDPSSPTSPHPHDYDASQSLPTTPRSALSRKFSLNEGTPPSSSPPIQRRSSLPPSSRAHHAPHIPPLPHTPLVTIPLRPCCPNCFSATESAALQGDDWTENFTHLARRRRSASVDNRPFPPHLPDNGSTIRWSMVKESPPAAFHSVLVVDEADHDVTPIADDVPSASDEQGLSEARKALDHLSVEDPVVDGILPPLLSRNKHWLEPIPSNNPSVVDLPLRPIVADDVLDNVLAAHGSPGSGSGSGSASPAASPLLQTPSSSPTISSASPRQRERESSPRIPGSFRLPKGSTLMRASSDILKGVSVMGGAPI